MKHDDEHPTHSQTRLAAAVPHDERARIEGMLDEAEQHLARRGLGFPMQYLELTLDAFRRIVGSWSTHPPTPYQLALVREHVAEALQLVKRTTPTIPVPRSA
jgi:hypothetical protein